MKRGCRKNPLYNTPFGRLRTNIRSKTFTNLISRVLLRNYWGKSAPEYAIVHQLPQEAGAPAFRPAPARLEGYFRYNLPEEQIVSFGLYDAEGKVVHHFFTNRKQLRGYHKFRFTFEIRNVPSGDYTVRLVSGNKTIEKMEVKF